MLGIRETQRRSYCATSLRRMTFISIQEICWFKIKTIFFTFGTGLGTHSGIVTIRFWITCLIQIYTYGHIMFLWSWYHLIADQPPTIDIFTCLEECFQKTILGYFYLQRKWKANNILEYMLEKAEHLLLCRRSWVQPLGSSSRTVKDSVWQYQARSTNGLILNEAACCIPNC